MHNPSQDLGKVFFALCKSVNTPKSLAAWLLFKYGSSELLDLTVDERHYTTASAFASDYLVVSFLEKYKGHSFGIDTKAVALRKFATAELKCRETNADFRSGLRGSSPRVQAILFMAQRKIGSLLGSVNPLLINEMCKWGPGATFGLTSRRCTVDYKISEVPIDVTPGAVGFLRAHIESDPLWFEALSGMVAQGPFCVLPCIFRLVDTNRVVTVPKNAKSDRTIAAEPTGNSFLQQGVGRFIRRRLLRVGIDLDDQQVNQKFASSAYSDNLATLDLSMASDTIAKELVFSLLPYDWAALLDRLRSPYGVLDGKRFLYEKFSSMGNAFTFELETLIFWALTQSVNEFENIRGSVAVYGDDIICPAACVPLLLEVLNSCGFSVNLEKSHWYGSFFESCGRHYFKGVDVTPVFQKALLSSTSEFIRCANRLRRWGLKSLHGLAVDPVVDHAWLALRRASKAHDLRAWSYAVPLGTEGDDGWLLSREEWTQCAAAPRFNPNRGYLCTVLRPVVRRRQGHNTALFAHYMRFPYVSRSSGEMSRGTVTPRSEPRYATRRAWVIPKWDFDLSC